VGVRQDVILNLKKLNLRTAIAEFWGIVEPSLILARHAFRGLKRPLAHNGDMHADRRMVIYSWRPMWDFVWVGDAHHGHLEKKSPPPKTVMVVIVREEQQLDPHGVYGSIKRWNWVKEDLILPHAPIEWGQRYAKKLWSREI